MLSGQRSITNNIINRATEQYRVKKLEDNIPRLKFGIINLHPAKQQYLPSDYDSVVDRKNDIIYHDRTEFDEFVATMISDYTMLAQSLIKLAEEKGASKDEIQKILSEKLGLFFLLPACEENIMTW